MKKIKNLIRFLIISFIVLIFFLFIGRILLRLIWNFDILSTKSYQILLEYWEKGGVFSTFKDISLGVVFILLPIIWLICSYKLYKYGLGRFLTIPIIKVYRKLTRPKNMEIEHVAIKNLGNKDKSLDEIISEKIKEKGVNNQEENTSRNLREQIAAKIKENEKQ